MERDGITDEEAEENIKEAVSALTNYIDNGDFTLANDVCEEFFGLEPDYLEELMGMV